MCFWGLYLSQVQGNHLSLTRQYINMGDTSRKSHQNITLYKKPIQQTLENQVTCHSSKVLCIIQCQIHKYWSFNFKNNVIIVMAGYAVRQIYWVNIWPRDCPSLITSLVFFGDQHPAHMFIPIYARIGKVLGSRPFLLPAFLAPPPKGAIWPNSMWPVKALTSFTVLHAPSAKYST